LHFYGLPCTTFPSGALPHFPPTRVRRSPTCHRQFSVDGRDHRPRPLDASAGAFVWPHGAAIKSARCPPANIRQGEILPRMPAGRGRHRNGGLRALGACALRSVIGLRLRLQRASKPATGRIGRPRHRAGHQAQLWRVRLLYPIHVTLSTTK
jgi:hypothetical protein